VNSRIIQTKLQIPRLHPKLVARNRLNNRIESGLAAGHQLTLVAAPAGFGKTTAICNWLYQTRFNRSWLSLDESDDETITFWMYFIASIQTVLPDFAKSTYNAFIQNPPSSIVNYLPVLLNEISQLDKILVMVLDDYHVITNPQIHDSIQFLLDHQPQQLHLIIVTRADPPLSIARLRAQRSLTELRAEDLRFTYDEACILLNDIIGLELTASDVKLLESRTEGWGVGLLLAAQSIQGRKNKSEFINSFSGNQYFILEYLIEEVLNRQKTETRKFLLQTSILDELSPELCNEITETVNGEEIIKQLRKENLFIIPLDQDHFWYRYHHLFADLLVNVLRKEYSQEEISNLHNRASHWYEEAGEFEKAIKHAINGQDHGHAAILIENIIEKLIARGMVRTVLGWMKVLPQGLLKDHPHLYIYYAWTLSLSGSYEEAEKILLAVKAKLITLPDSPEILALRGEVSALLTGIITFYNDPSRTLKEAQEALAFLPQDKLSSRARVFNALGIANAYLDNLQQAITYFQKARDLALESGNHFLAATAIEMLAGIQIFHLGHLSEASRSLNQVLELGRISDNDFQSFTGSALILLAEINIEQNNLETAVNLLEKGFRLVNLGGIRYSLAYSYCTKARLKIALGEEEEAIMALRAAASATEKSPLVHILIHNFSCQIKSLLLLGDIKTATQWAEDYQVFMKSDLANNLPNYLYEIRQITLAHLYLAQDEIEKALETLTPISVQAESAGRLRHLIEIYLLESIALIKLDKKEEAFKAFEKCLVIANSEEVIRIFIDAKENIENLLEMARAKGLLIGFLNKITIAKNFTQNNVSSELGSSSAQNGLIEPLTDRELEILRLLCEGHSNQEIAEVLIVSVNTVKKHTSNIYGKLGVRNRTQAILSAREMTLFN